jgi:hypothetical protein
MKSLRFGICIECKDLVRGVLDLFMNFESFMVDERERGERFEDRNTPPHFAMLQPWSNAILNIGLICLVSI